MVGGAGRGGPRQSLKSQAEGAFDLGALVSGFFEVGLDGAGFRGARGGFALLRLLDLGNEPFDFVRDRGELEGPAGRSRLGGVGRRGGEGSGEWASRKKVNSHGVATSLLDRGCGEVAAKPREATA